MRVVSEHCRLLLNRSAHFSMPRGIFFTAFITPADLPYSAGHTVFSHHLFRRSLDSSEKTETSANRPPQTCLNRARPLAKLAGGAERKRRPTGQKAEHEHIMRESCA
jgi:hypothetical protein